MKNNEIRYWPLYRKPDCNERAFPKGFLLAIFACLILWILLGLWIYWANS